MNAPGSPQAVVVGTGRCGTGYVSQLLNASGVRSGHELWFNPYEASQRVAGLAVDSSWLALPAIETGEWSGRVAHIVRNPVAVVRSLVGVEFFHPQEASSPFSAYARKHCPEVNGLPPLDAAVEWWVNWNARCAAVADISLRVEDLQYQWAIDELGSALRVELSPSCSVSTRYNSRRRAGIRHSDIRRLLHGREANYGYRI